MHKPLHKFVKKFDNGKGTKWSSTYEKVKEDIEVVNKWNGEPPIEEDIKKPTD